MDNMFETMHAAQGIGLAAPQVGRRERMTVIDIEGAQYVLINPEIVERQGSDKAEEGCLSAPRRFASDHTRFTYFRSTGRHPDVEVFDDTRNHVVVMCGLPGAGKDTYIREHFPEMAVVSLDERR